MFKTQISDFVNDKKFSKVLDVGCGTRPYESLIKTNDYVGIDVHVSGRESHGKKANVFYDGVNIPFEDSTFDLVLCNQVLEHADRPEELLKDISRIMKPNAFLILSVPFFWPEHEIPYDFQRYTSFGLKKMISQNQLSVLHHEKTLSGLSALQTIINSEINKESNIKFKSFKLLIVNIGFKVLRLLFKNYKSERLYLDNFFICQKKTTT